MKTTFTFLLSLLMSISVFAFSNQGRLSISSASKTQVRVVVDGRTYTDRDNDRQEVLIRNINPGYHSIKVYQYRYGRNGSNRGAFNSMRLLYEGRVYVRPDYHVDVLINRFGKALVDERPISGGYYGNQWDNDDDRDWDDDGYYGYNREMDSRSFDQLKQTIRNEHFDSGKMSIAKQGASQNFFSTAQVKELVQLMSFESSKLDLAKHCYSRTTDKQNYFLINDVFSFSTSKEELARYIREQQ